MCFIVPLFFPSSHLTEVSSKILLSFCIWFSLLAFYQIITSFLPLKSCFTPIDLSALRCFALARLFGSICPLILINPSSHSPTQISLAYTEAIVLSQFLSNVPYEKVFALIREHLGLLDPTLFEFIWDIPILENLICTLHSCHSSQLSKLLRIRTGIYPIVTLRVLTLTIFIDVDNFMRMPDNAGVDRATQLKQHIGKPDLNVFNDLSLRKRFIFSLKVKFLKRISVERISRLQLPFEI